MYCLYCIFAAVKKIKIDVAPESTKSEFLYIKPNEQLFAQSDNPVFTHVSVSSFRFNRLFF